MKSVIPKLFIVALCSVFVFSNCKKDDDTPPTGEQYDPQTAGSTWTYRTTSTQNPAPPVTITNTFTASSRDTAISGKTYRVLTNSNGPNSYKTKVGNEYYRYGQFAALGATGVDELYLKDGLDVNASWSFSQTFTVPVNNVPTPVPATFTYKIAEKGINRTVDSRPYTDVIHVRLDITAVIANVGGGDFYYAKGIGLIEGNLSINVAFANLTFNSSQILTSYDIR